MITSQPFEAIYNSQYVEINAEDHFVPVFYEGDSYDFYQTRLETTRNQVTTIWNKEDIIYGQITF